MPRKPIPYLGAWINADPAPKAKPFRLRPGSVIYVSGNTTPYIIWAGDAFIVRAKSEPDSTARDPHG